LRFYFLCRNIRFFILIFKFVFVIGPQKLQIDLVTAIFRWEKKPYKYWLRYWKKINVIEGHKKYRRVFWELDRLNKIGVKKYEIKWNKVNKDHRKINIKLYRKYFM